MVSLQVLLACGRGLVLLVLPNHDNTITNCIIYDWLNSVGGTDITHPRPGETTAVQLAYCYEQLLPPMKSETVV